MSYQYDRYLERHKANVEKGFRWLQKYLPAITEGSGAEHNIIFAHDASKLNPDEYEAYDAYFYGGNRSYAVVQDCYTFIEIRIIGSIGFLSMMIPKKGKFS